MERETTGLYLTGHPMDDYRASARKVGAVPILAINEDFDREDGPQRFRDGQRVTIAGVVSSARTRATRSNSMMAYVMMEDGTASIEMLCFSSTLQRCGSYLKENQAIVAKGKLSVRDEKQPQLLCDSAYPLKENPEDMAVPDQPKEQILEGGALFLRVPSVDAPIFRHLQLVLQMFPGEIPVKIRLADTGKLLGTSCMLHASLLRELRETLGEENVVVR